jgi:hypothetical protein
MLAEHAVETFWRMLSVHLTAIIFLNFYKNKKNTQRVKIKKKKFRSWQMSSNVTITI